jgi:hypothetical protein
MTDRKIDLSPLDPSRDPLRWERMVRSVAARGAEAAARGRPATLALQLVAWARPAMAAAAALALAVWVPAWLRAGPTATTTPPSTTTPAGTAADTAARLAAWAATDESATASSLLLTLGDDDASR